MNLNIIYSILSRLVSSYEEHEIFEGIEQLSLYMAEIAKTPAASAAAQEKYNSLHSDVFMKLHNLDANNFSSFEIEYLKQTPYDFLLPGNLRSEILSAESGKSLTPVSSKKKYEELEAVLDVKLVSAKSLVASLSEIGAQNYIEPGEAFLALIMTSESFNSELKKFHTDLKTFEQGLTFLIQGSSAEKVSPKIHALSNITPITIVSVSIGLILAVAKVIEKALDIAIKKKEYDKLGIEIGISNVKLADQLNEHVEKMRNSEIETLVTELSERNTPDNQVKIRKGIEKIFSLIEKGHTIDFVVAEPEELDEGEEASVDILSFEQFKDIRKISYDLKKLQTEDVTSFLLEAPAEHSDGTQEE